MSVTTAIGASSKIATLTCSCGKVKLTLPNAVPKSKLNLWTMDWPEEKMKALALNEKSASGEALPQIFDVMTALEEKPITDLISALKIEASTKPENSISYAELCDGMEIEIEKSFFDESRAHLPGNKP